VTTRRYAALVGATSCEVYLVQGEVADGGGQVGKNVLMLVNLRQSATYTCVASSELGNIAYDVDVIVKGTVTRADNF